MNKKGTFWRSFFTFAAILSLAGCANAPIIQPEVNSLIVANRPNIAVEVMGKDEEAYGDENVLLYWLDKGMAYQLSGNYAGSIQAYAQAQRVADKLYTQSLSKKFATLLINDYANDYRAEPYEYSLMNVFQAMNFAVQSRFNEALVEARDFDYRMRLLKQIYEGKDAYYQDDPFVRMVMGLLYESAGGEQNYNDAYISYAKSFELYRQMYKDQEDAQAPQLLRENLGILAQYFGNSGTPMIARGVSLQKRQNLSRLIIVEYAGFSPLKVPSSLVVPVDRQSTVTISIPTLTNRFYDNVNSRVSVMSRGSVVRQQNLFVGLNIGQVAHKVHKQKRIWLTTKSVIRPILKYLIQRAARDQMAEKNGQTSGDILNLMFNTYNMYSERADLRSWQTLPNEIRIEQIWLEPGEYQVNLEGFSERGEAIDKHVWDSVVLQPGQTKWLVRRSYK